MADRLLTTSGNLWQTYSRRSSRESSIYLGTFHYSKDGNLFFPSPRPNKPCRAHKTFFELASYLSHLSSLRFQLAHTVHLHIPLNQTTNLPRHIASTLPRPILQRHFQDESFSKTPAPGLRGVLQHLKRRRGRPNRPNDRAARIPCTRRRCEHRAPAHRGKGALHQIRTRNEAGHIEDTIGSPETRDCWTTRECPVPGA